jgi:hypothetical protein
MCHPLKNYQTCYGMQALQMELVGQENLSLGATAILADTQQIQQ